MSGLLDPVAEHAAKLDPRVRELARDPFASLPEFVYNLQCEAHPAISGQVVLRYPTMGDQLDIERLSVPGRPISQVLATLQVVVSKAPKSWYTLAPGAQTPTLALSRLPYAPEVFDLYGAFIGWRDSFRRGGDQGAAGAPE